MNQTDIVKMLTFMKPHEPYMVIDDTTVMSWSAVLDHNAPDLNGSWLYEFVVSYYGVNEGGLTAAKVCEAWRRKKEIALHKEVAPYEKAYRMGEISHDTFIYELNRLREEAGPFPKPMAVTTGSEW